MRYDDYKQQKGGNCSALFISQKPIYLLIPSFLKKQQNHLFFPRRKATSLTNSLKVRFLRGFLIKNKTKNNILYNNNTFYFLVTSFFCNTLYYIFKVSRYIYMGTYYLVCYFIYFNLKRFYRG